MAVTTDRQVVSNGSNSRGLAPLVQRPPPVAEHIARNVTRVPSAVTYTWVLPSTLLLAGNVHAWRSLLTMFHGIRDDSSPILLHGPIGCGKTFGVRLMCAGIAWKQFIVDASMTHREVTDVFDHLSGASCFGSRALLWIEDADGMTAEMISWVRVGMCRFPNVLVLATAVNRYHLRLTEWRAWRHVRLYRPRDSDVMKLMTHVFTGTSTAFISRLTGSCFGDLRRCTMAMQRNTPGGVIDANQTIFEATQDLFSRRISPIAYVDGFQDTKRICLELAFRNYHAVGKGKLDDLQDIADLADAFSTADSTACDATWMSLCGKLARDVLPSTCKCPPLYLGKTPPSTGVPSRPVMLDSPMLLGGRRLPYTCLQNHT